MQSGWKFGQDGISTNESTLNPKISNCNVDSTEHNGLNRVTYLYAAIPESGDPVYSTTVPTNVGTYLVKARIPESDNYQEFNTVAVEFAITQAKLATPANLKMSPVESSVPYGLVSWDSVNGITKTSTNRLSQDVTVTYKLVIEELQNNEYVVKDTIDNLTSTSIDVTEYIQGVGDYQYKVQAVSSDETNCASSDFTAYNKISIAGNLTVVDNGKPDTEISSNTYTKTYDAKNVVLTAPTKEGFGNYKWYKDGVLISETSNVLNIMHVNESGKYVCVIADDSGNICYTSYQTVTINKRELSLYKQDIDEVYDGNNHSVTVGTNDYVSGSSTVAESDVLQLNNVTISQTNAGEYTNFDVSPTWTVSNGTNDVSGDYKVTISAKLTVNKATIDNPSGDQSYTYNGSLQGTALTVTTVNNQGYTVYYGDSSDNCTSTAVPQITTVAESKPVYYKVTASNHNDLTGSYNLTITSKNVSDLTVGNISDVTYTGMAITPEPKVTYGSITLNKGTDFDYSYSNNTNVGTATVTITGKGNYTGTKEVTFNIKQASVTVKANALSKTYGDTDPTFTATVTGMVNGESAEDKLTYTITRGTGENAGQYAYTITGDTSQGNYTVTYDVTNKFTINKRVITIESGINVDDREYDGTKKVYTGNDNNQVHYDYSSSSYGNVVEGDSIKFTAIFDDDAYDDPKVNIDAISKEIVDRTVSIKDLVLDADSSKNYEIDVVNSIKTVPSKILKANVEVKANDNSKYFGQVEPTLSYSYTKINNETLDLNIAREEGEKVGTYPIHLSQQPDANPNYNLTFVDGVFTIKKASVTGKNIYINLKLGNDSIFDLDTIVNLSEVSYKLPEEYTAKITNVIDKNNLFKQTPTVDGSEVHFGFRDAETITADETAIIVVTISSRDLENFNVVLNVKVVKSHTDTSIIPSGWSIKGDTPELIPGTIQRVDIVDNSDSTNTDTIDIYVLPEIIYHYDEAVSEKPEITDDVYTKTIDNLAVVHCTGDINYLQEVYLDGELIISKDKSTGEFVYDENMCTLEEGSTIIRFTQSYMDTMLIGYHDVQMKYESGWAYTTVLVKELPSEQSSSSDSTTTSVTKKTTVKSTKVEEISKAGDTIVEQTKENSLTTNAVSSETTTESIIATWALLDLIIAILSIVFAIIALFRKGKRLYCITCIVNILIFIFTQDLKGKMIIIDKYTIIMAIILIIEILLIFIRRKKMKMMSKNKNCLKVS